jgi:hypothetical protein
MMGQDSAILNSAALMASLLSLAISSMLVMRQVRLARHSSQLPVLVQLSAEARRPPPPCQPTFVDGLALTRKIEAAGTAMQPPNQPRVRRTGSGQGKPLARPVVTNVPLPGGAWRVVRSSRPQPS